MMGNGEVRKRKVDKGREGRREGRRGREGGREGKKEGRRERST